MRILLDECVPRKLRDLLSSHIVETVPEAGWAGVKNGELLSLAASSYDVMITVDRKMVDQRDSCKIGLPVVVIIGRSTQLKHIKHLIPKINELLQTSLSPGFHLVND